MKPTLKKLLFSNAFARSVSVLAGGTAAGQLIVVAASPILTRLYSPEDFGLLAVYAAILGMLGVIASLRYQLAIPLPNNDKEAASIAVLSLLVVAFMTLLTSVVVWLFGVQLVNLLGAPGLIPYLWMIPIGLLLVGVYQVFQYWAIRTRKFSNVARTRFSQSLFMVITQIGGYALGPVALLFGRVVGQSAGIIGLGRSAFRNSSDHFRNVNVEKVIKSAGQHRKFPLVSTWAGLASAAGAQLPPLLIAAFLGIGAAGLFSLAQRVLAQPMSIVGKAISDVFYQKATHAHREGGLAQIVQSVFSTLLVLGVPPAIAAFIFAPDIFVLVFGSDWHSAGMVARWMIPWMLSDFVVSPCTGIYPIINKHGVALRFQVALMISGIIGSVVGGWYLESLLASIAMISLLNSGIYLSRLLNVFSIIEVRASVPLLMIIKSMFISSIIVSPVFVLWILDLPSLLLIVGCSLFSAFIWLLFAVKHAKTMVLR